VLWYKAWLETRSRFLASLCGMTVILTFFVHHAESVISPLPKTDTYQIFFFANQYLVGFWILSVVLLGMGGLIRERAVGTSSFTLALPVSPWIVILLTSNLNAREFPISQAGFYATLLVSGGLIYFSLSVLISSLIEGEFTAPAVAYGLTVLSVMFFATDDRIRPYADVWRYMSGNNQLNKSTYLLTGPFPWTGFVASVAVAGALLLASVVVIQRREF
jgi:ABC-2 type transport system permease protein